MVMFRIVTILFFLGFSGHAFAQANDSAVSPEQASLVQEQAAICASYARVMEYSGLFEERQGELWRERRFFAGAILRGSIAEMTGTQPTNADIDSVINEYSGWMLDLFTANNVISDKDKVKERDKLRDYISNFCTSVFKNADKAIVKVRPDLFLGSDANPSIADTDIPELEAEASEQVTRLLQENIKLQEAVNAMSKLIKEKDEALLLSADALDEARKREIEKKEERKANSQNAALSEERAATIIGDTLAPPPRKPPLPLLYAAKEDEVITPGPTKPLKEVGLTQIQLASYSTIKNANKGLNLLAKEKPEAFKKVELSVTAAKLASGKNVFRVVSSPIAINIAKDLCSHYWSQQYACIIRMMPSS